MKRRARFGKEWEERYWDVQLRATVRRHARRLGLNPNEVERRWKARLAKRIA